MYDLHDLDHILQGVVSLSHSSCAHARRVGSLRMCRYDVALTQRLTTHNDNYKLNIIWIATLPDVCNLALTNKPRRSTHDAKPSYQ